MVMLGGLIVSFLLVKLHPVTRWTTSIQRDATPKGLDLDRAVFLAEASSAAYNTDEGKAWASKNGFSNYEPFDVLNPPANTQGFYCWDKEGENRRAVLAFRGSDDVWDWLRNFSLMELPAFKSWVKVHAGFYTGVMATVLIDAVMKKVPQAKLKCRCTRLANRSLGTTPFARASTKR
jgi:hypothetical protein